MTRQVYPVHGDELAFTGPDVTSRTVPGDALSAEFPEFASPHFEECTSN